MNEDRRDLPPPSNGMREKKVRSRKSVIVFFAVGILMVCIPLVIVFGWSAETCRGTVQDFCLGSKLYRTSTTILPYVMLIGGAVIAFNMKRVSDMIYSSDEDDSDTPSG